ncbi:MAG TPA: hypothetical protein VGC91_15290 [Pyrinomonadaceae bacterium]
MTEERYDIERLLRLRKLTRSIADHLRGQMKGYLSTLAPLIRPRAVLGDYVQSSTRETSKIADSAFKDLQAVYDAVARSSPFNLSSELKPPVEIISAALEMTPMEYSYEAKTERESKQVTVVSPLKWMLTYSGFAPGRLKEMLRDRGRAGEEVQRFILHYMVMHVVMQKQTGVTEILDALHFPVTYGTEADFGGLPLTYISSSISTVRPPDSVIIESTEISGNDVFEEIVRLEDIAAMRDPLKQQLTELVESQGEKLP